MKKWGTMVKFSEIPESILTLAREVYLKRYNSEVPPGATMGVLAPNFESVALEMYYKSIFRNEVSNLWL